MASVHKVGEPVDDNERKAISYFARHLPDHYHIYHNLELPTRSGLSYRPPPLKAPAIHPWG